MIPPRGRHFFANPGPTNIPDSVLLATAHASVDFNDPGFFAVYEAGRAGLGRILRQDSGELFLYTASGHGAWDATLVNLFSPGDRLLMIASGYFSDAWAAMAARLGLVVETVAADWRRGAEIAAIEKALRADTKGTIRAVCAVHNETSTGLCLPLPAIRAAIDAARHSALFLADTISSLGSFDFRMSEWGVDAVVGGSQKGLMLPAGMSFTAVSERGMAAHREAGLARGYFDWSAMLDRPHKSFMGTVPVTFFYGLRESLRLIEEEGLENVFSRHRRLAGAVRAAVRAWSGNHGPALYCLNPERLSDSVTTLLMPDGFDAEAVRTIARERFNVSLGGGLGALGGKVFRIGHLGDLNEAMVMGALAAVEMSLQRAGIPHGTGALDAAVAALAA